MLRLPSKLSVTLDGHTQKRTSPTYLNNSTSGRFFSFLFFSSGNKGRRPHLRLTCTLPASVFSTGSQFGNRVMPILEDDGKDNGHHKSITGKG